jgi:hypothetical protein
MRRLLSLPLAISLATTGLVPACAPAGEDEDLEIVPQGKEDNYYSDVAVEFELTGSLPVAMTAEEHADPARRDDLVARRLTAVGLYLTTYVSDKFRGIDINNDGRIDESEVFFRNEGYGGFHAMVRNGTARATAIEGDAQAGYHVEFILDVAGPKDLLRMLPRVEGVTGFAFDLAMPKGATMDPDNVSRGLIRSFDPRTHVGELETVRLHARPLPRPANAYPQLAAMVADGKLDVTLLYGHDYNTPRSDLAEAREAFAWLRARGFTAPAATFEALAADSGPFTRRVTAGGAPLEIEVRIFHADMFVGRAREHHDLAVAELTSRDIFFYNGHAGPYFGLYIDGPKAATVSYQELRDAPFSAKQQLVVAQGCQTYSQYADMIYASPRKDESNLDVVTTVNYSYGLGTLELLEGLIGTDRAGRHLAVDVHTLIARLNDDWYNRREHVFYGIMGLEGNPQLHPYADVAKIGAACAAATDCGDPNGNVCARAAGGSRQCAAVALDRAACPAGTTFASVAASRTIKTNACVAR